MFAGLIVTTVLMAPPDNRGLTPPGSPVLGLPTPSFAITPDRKDALSRFGAGVWQARRDRLLSAAKAFEAVAKQDPDATEPLKELVRIYSQIGREPEAIRLAKKILEKNPRDADTAQVLARLLFDAGELNDAVAAAKVAAANLDAVEHPAKAVAIYRDLATLCERAGDATEAIAALRNAIGLLTVNRKAVLATRDFTPKEIDDAAADTWERLGRVSVKASKYDDAADAFRAAHALFADPDKLNNPQAAARLGWNLSGVYAAKGESATALQHLESFLKLRPLSAEPYERLAALLRTVGRGADVVPRLQKLHAADSKNHFVQAVLATELARDTANRNEADDLFTKLHAATNDPKIVRVIVRSHVECDRPGKVIAELDRAYAALKSDDPKQAEARKFAAEKARVIAELLRTEPDWAAAVMRAASEDLRGGVKRTHQTWHILGLLAARHHKLELAIPQFRQAVNNAPKETEADAYAGLIDVLWRSRRPADVATTCREGLQRAEWTAPVFFNFHLALALAELGDADDAIAAVDKAILQAAEMDRLTVRLRKVFVLRVLAKWDDAVALCKKLLDEFDGPADQFRIRYSLATVYWGAGKFDESEKELRTILDVDPDHAGANNDLGYHLADQSRNLDEAERLVRHAIAVDRFDRRKSGDPEPENAAYMDSLAWVLFRKDKLPEARDLLLKVSAMPDGAGDATVWDHLGDVYFRLGEKPLAKKAWTQALGLYQTDSRGKRDGRLDEVKRKLTRIQ